MKDSRSMLLISLGPIQDFIRSARRCQDLWFGSWLLSELARAVGESVQKSVGTEGVVVFPAGLARGLGDNERPGVANLIFSVLPASLAPRDVAEAARAALNAELERIAGKVFAPLLSPGYAAFFHHDVAMQQLRDLMELSWVAVPCTAGGYADDRRELYRRLAALKNTKAWGQPAWTERAGLGVPKSSLDGERESVIDEAIFDGARGGLSATRRRARFGLKGKERLCGVSLLKRLGHGLDPRHFRGGKPAFHSTSHVAAGPLLQRIHAQGDHGHRAAESYLSKLRELGLDLGRFRVERPDAVLGGPLTLVGHDGSLLFPSRMKDHFTENFAGVEGREDERDFGQLEQRQQDDTLEAARRALRDLMAAVDGPSEPCAYYAYLLADGDNMGAAIDNIGDVDGHLALAAALNEFAGGCRKIVRDHEGTLIFSGGDDVLALLPLHRALECARALAKSFGAGLGGYTTKNGVSPSLSVGLAVAHAREPMSEARALAERAEKMAKAHPGKNALSIIVAKRSGGDLCLVGGWSGEAPNAGGRNAADRSSRPLDERIKAWVRVLREGGLSSKTAHDLEQVATHYEGLEDKAQEARIAEITALCGQVLGRKRGRGGVDDADKQAIEDLLQPLGWTHSGLSPALRVRRLSEELQVARLFWQAIDEGTSNPAPEAVETGWPQDEQQGVRE